MADTGLKAWIYRYENPGNILEIPDAKTVFNGDAVNDGELLGTLYENDGLTPTEKGDGFGSGWSGSPALPDLDTFIGFDLLSIASMRIAHSMRNRQYIYEGDISGIFPYLSATLINGLSGFFFCAGLRINYAKQISTVRLQQLHSGKLSPPISGVTVEPEYENTIKPVING